MPLCVLVSTVLCFVSTEHLYRAVHGGSRAPSTGGMSRCPFRVALQSKKQLHTATASVPESRPTATQEEKKEKVTTAPPPLPSPTVVNSREMAAMKCEVKRLTKDGHCECAAQGLQPVGEHDYVNYHLHSMNNLCAMNCMCQVAVYM